MRCGVHYDAHAFWKVSGILCFQAHGWLMGIALIILLPISMIVAATLRSTVRPSYWFQIHRALGVGLPIPLNLFIKIIEQ